MTVRKRGQGYMADFMVKGTRYRETFDTEVEAERWELETRAAIRDGRPLPGINNGKSDKGGSLSLLGPLFDYTKEHHWENNPKIKAPEVQIQSASEAVDFFGRNKIVSEIDTDEMKRFVRHIVESGRSFSTADRKLSALSKMLHCGVEKGVIGRVPKVPLSKETQERIRFLTKDEAQTIMGLWREWGQDDLHNFTVFAIHTGARLSAILNLRWNSFSPAYQTVYFVGGKEDKNSKSRTLPLSKTAQEAVLDMKRRHPDQRGPFSHLKKDGKLRTWWERMREHTGYDDVVIHTLRHTCASWMVQKGVDLKRVQTWLGHKNIATTLIYAKLAPGDLQDCAPILEDMLAPSKPELRIVSAG